MKGLKELVQFYRTSTIDRWNSALWPDSIIPEACSQRGDRSFLYPLQGHCPRKNPGRLTCAMPAHHAE